LGGLGATVKLNVLGHAQNEKISALSVAGPFSPNLSVRFIFIIIYYLLLEIIIYNILSIY